MTEEEKNKYIIDKVVLKESTNKGKFFIYRNVIIEMFKLWFSNNKKIILILAQLPILFGFMTLFNKISFITGFKNGVISISLILLAEALYELSIAIFKKE